MNDISLSCQLENKFFETHRSKLYKLILLVLILWKNRQDTHQHIARHFKILPNTLKNKLQCSQCRIR